MRLRLNVPLYGTIRLSPPTQESFSSRLTPHSSLKTVLPPSFGNQLSDTGVHGNFRWPRRHPLPRELAGGIDTEPAAERQTALRTILPACNIRNRQVPCPVRTVEDLPE